MNIHEAIKERHSVRSYLDKPIPEDIIAELQNEIQKCNEEENLHIQLITNEKEAFTGILARYGSFKGVQNYLALVGKKSNDYEEKLGYYGEKLVLLAQTLGLNTCWVAGTFSKRKAKIQIDSGEKFVCVIALGYGATQGVPHKNKSMEQLCKVEGEMPDWFRAGMEAVMLAPTAINQQKFLFTLSGNGVKAKALTGPHSKTDLGIAKYHFEIGAGKEHFNWV